MKNTNTNATQLSQKTLPSTQTRDTAAPAGMSLAEIRSLVLETIG